MTISQISGITPFPSAFDLQHAITTHVRNSDATAVPAALEAPVGKQHLRHAKDLQDAWLKNMQSALDRQALSGLQIQEGETMADGIARIAEKLQSAPGTDRSLIAFYEGLAQALRNAGIEIRLNQALTTEMPASSSLHVHEHEHFLRIFGMQISLIDPEEGIHACSISTHMLSPLFAGAKNWPGYYRDKVDLMLRKFSTFLAEAGVSHSTAERVMNIGIYTALCLGAGFAGYTGIKEFLHGWRLLQKKVDDRDEMRKMLAQMDAYPPHLQNTSFIGNRRRLAVDRIECLDEEIKQTRASLMVGASGAFTGFVLLALGAMRVVAESCHSQQKCGGAVGQLGKLMPGFQNVAAVGAAAIGAAFIYKSTRYSAAIAKGKAALRDIMPPSIARNRTSATEEEGISEAARSYLQSVEKNIAKHSGFIGSFHRMMAAFLFSSILNFICNVIDDALYIYSETHDKARDMGRRKDFEILMQVNVIAYAVAAFVMAISSLKFFRGHPALMKIEGAQHDEKGERGWSFHLMNEVMNPAAGMGLRTAFHAYLTGCHEASQLFLRKVELRAGAKAAAASLPESMREHVSKREVAKFIDDVLQLKAAFLLEKVGAAGLILEQIINEDQLHADGQGNEGATREIVEQFRMRSKDMIVYQQTMLLMDAVRQWEHNEPGADQDNLAAYLKATLSDEIHDPTRPLSEAEMNLSVHDVLASFILKSGKVKDDQERIGFFDHMHSAVINSAPAEEREALPAGERAGQ